MLPVSLNTLQANFAVPRGRVALTLTRATQQVEGIK